MEQHSYKQVAIFLFNGIEVYSTSGKIEKEKKRLGMKATKYIITA